MTCYMYVSLQDDDKIFVFSMDTETGKLTPKSETPVPGGPSPLAISPDRRVLYAGHRGSSEISRWRAVAGGPRGIAGRPATLTDTAI